MEKLCSQEAVEGDPVSFKVCVIGKPQPQVRWYWQGVQLVSSPDFVITQEGHVHSLHIPESFREDSGKFTVLAENVAGQDQCSAQLNVKGSCIF